MQPLWTWGGKYFGSRNGNRLMTHDGRHVGRFYGNEVYSANGHYLGEIKNGNRLITKRSRKNSRKPSFSPSTRTSTAKRGRYGRNAMIAGYEDFPNPEDF